MQKGIRHFAVSAAAAVAAGLAPLVAGAQAGPYLGVGYGAYQIDEDIIDKNDALWKAYFGVMLNSALGLEASYVDFSQAKDQGSSFDAKGYGGALLLGIPLASNFTLYAKGGEFFWDAQSNFAGARTDDSDHDPFYGAGLQFRLNERVGLRLEYERYKVSEVDLDSANVSLQTQF